MRRFDDSQLLNALQQRNELKEEHLLQLAEQLADFHAKLAPGLPPSNLGTPEAVWFPAQQNFDQIRDLLDDADSLKQLKTTGRLV